MICDLIKNLSKYELIKPYLHDIEDILNQIDLNNFSTGTIQINDHLKAIFTSYETKPKEETIIESHEIYCDLVIVLEGEEMIYVDLFEKEIMNKQNDLISYKSCDELISIHMKPNMFALFLPSEIHHPYCNYQKTEKIKKVTFKLMLNY